MNSASNRGKGDAMKIGIVTKHNSINYGAVLQAYALQQFLQAEQIASEIIDFGERTVSVRRGRPSSPRALLDFAVTAAHRRALETSLARFNSFLDDNMTLTRRFHTEQELEEQYSQPEILLSGSDQVFHPLQLTPRYYLRFARPETVRASYAASMGVTAIPPQNRERYLDALQQFDFLSVREKTAQQLLQNELSRPVSVHIDPIFLPEQWESVERPADPGFRYILCYLLYRPKWINEYLRALKKKLGLKTVLIDLTGSYRGIYCDKTVRDAGPQEFLWLFQHAEYVVTSSFHGAAFSIRMQKPFSALVNPSAPMRISDLLATFGLEHRRLDACPADSFPPADGEDLQGVPSVIRSQREKARQYVEQITAEAEKRRRLQ